MKQHQITRISLLLILFFIVYGTGVSAQDTTAGEPSVNLRYFVSNNNIQYLIVQSRSKVGKKFYPVPHQAVQVYLDSNAAENLVSKTVTDKTGEAKIGISHTLKDKWNNSSKHTFIALLKGAKEADDLTTTLEITKAKIEIDTSNNDGIRTINVKVNYFENNNWVPAKDVEMKVGVDRSGSILSAGDEATYTTDSSGMVSVEFKKEKLPGAQKGNIMLAAKVEDNDLYGNLLVQKTVPWGVAILHNNNFFNQRTLWSTKFRTPLWLVLIAYSIVIAVWGTIIYLVLQIVKIKKLGDAV